MYNLKTPLFLLLVSILILTLLTGFLVHGEYVPYRWRDNVEGFVNFVRVSNDGKYVSAALSAPSRVILYTNDGKKIWEKLFENGYVQCIDIEPNNNAIAVSFSWDVGEKTYFKVYVLNIADGSVIWESETFAGSGWEIEYSPNGRYIVATTSLDSIIILDTFREYEAQTLDLSMDNTFGIAISNDKIFVGGFRGEPYSGIILCIDISSKKIIWSNDQLEDSVISLKISTNESVLYAGIAIDEANNKRTGKIIALDINNGEKLWETSKYDSYVWEIDELKNGWLIGALGDLGIVILDSQTGEELNKISIPNGTGVFSIETIPDKIGFVLGTNKRIEENKYVAEIYYLILREKEGYTSSGITTSVTDTINTTQQFKTLPESWGPLWIRDDIKTIPNFNWVSITPSPDGKLVGIIHWKENKITITILRTSNGKTIYSASVDKTGRYYSTELFWSPDSTVLYACLGISSAENLRIIALNTITYSITWNKEIPSNIDMVTLSRDGKYFMLVNTIYHDSQVFIVSTENGNVVNEFPISKYIEGYCIDSIAPGLRANSFIIALSPHSESIDHILVYELINPLSLSKKTYPR